MVRFIFITLMIMVLLSDKSYASADSNVIKTKMLRDYGIAYDIPLKAMSHKGTYNDIQDNNLVISRSSYIRTGCFAESPWIKTAGTALNVRVYPRFQVRWWGTLGPDSGEEEDLFEIRISQRKNKKDNSPKERRFYMHTGDLTKEWGAVHEGGDTYYRGRLTNVFHDDYEKLESSRNLRFGPMEIAKHNEFKVALCNIQPSVEVKLNSFVVTAESR